MKINEPPLEKELIRLYQPHCYLPPWAETSMKQNLAGLVKDQKEQLLISFYSKD